MREISRGIYPKLPWKTDLQQCLETGLRSFPRFFLKSVKSLPWVPEVFLARFPVSVMSL